MDLFLEVIPHIDALQLKGLILTTGIIVEGVKFCFFGWFFLTLQHDIKERELGQIQK